MAVSVVDCLVCFVMVLGEMVNSSTMVVTPSFLVQCRLVSYFMPCYRRPESVVLCCVQFFRIDSYNCISHVYHSYQEYIFRH